jgi:hypothetical protein
MKTIPNQVYRIQPTGLGLNHRSETSSGDLADGVHVFVSFQEVYQAVLEWMDDPNCPTPEIVTIACRKAFLKDSGDYEGWLLPSGCGKIVSRQAFDSWAALRQFLAKVCGE